MAGLAASQWGVEAAASRPSKRAGPDAVISHFAAAFLWGMLETVQRASPTSLRQRTSHPAINTHETKQIDATTLHGIPVTTPIQTLIHLSSVLPFKTLRRAVNEALNRRLITPIDRHLPPPRRQEAPPSPRHGRPPRSENENLALHLLDAAGIAKPLVNPAIPRAAKIPDFLWPALHNLVLEADSRRYHGNLLARADDADKQAELEALGYTVIRTSWAEMTTRPPHARPRSARADPRGPTGRVVVEVRIDGPAARCPSSPARAAGARRTRCPATRRRSTRGRPEGAVGPSQRREHTERIPVPLAARRFAQPAHRNAGAHADQ